MIERKIGDRFCVEQNFQRITYEVKAKGDNSCFVCDFFGRSGCSKNSRMDAGTCSGKYRKDHTNIYFKKVDVKYL